MTLLYRPVLQGREIPDDTLGLTYVSMHFVVDDAGLPLNSDMVQRIIFARLNVKVYRKGSFVTVKHLADPKHPLTVKVAIFARRKRHELIPECIRLCEQRGLSGIQDRELAS